MPRVFLVKEPHDRIDLTTAADFGELRFIFTPDVRRVSVFDVVRFAQHALDRLDAEDFDPNVDAYCMCGKLVEVAMLFGAMIARYGLVRVLIWNASECRYMLRTMNEDDYRKDESDDDI